MMRALALINLGWALLIWASCDPPPSAHPSSPDLNHPTSIISFTYSDSLYRFLKPGTASSFWTWTCQDNVGGTTAGTAWLELGHGHGRWRFAVASAGLNASSPGCNLLTLTPRDTQRWHNLSLPWPPADETPLLPLPRQPLASAHYADLLHLLQDLTDPWFAQVVTRWPHHPIPVRAPAALSGELDLSDCLYQAVEVWNHTGFDSLFRWDPGAGWGVRLVHFTGTHRHPPLATRMVRLDPEGRPYRVHIVAGDNYDDERDRPYAIRGMVHELGHALLLWGHSEDRQHVLWGRAPPLVSEPADDELRALALWNLLPEGLSLTWYSRSTELNPVGQHRQRAPVEERQGGQHPRVGQFLGDLQPGDGDRGQCGPLRGTLPQ